MQVTVLLSTSAAKGEDQYTWYKYQLNVDFILPYRKSSLALKSGMIFGIRPSSSKAKSESRLVLQGEVTKVVTITQNEKAVLLERSDPLKSSRTVRPLSSNVPKPSMQNVSDHKAKQMQQTLMERPFIQALKSKIDKGLKIDSPSQDLVRYFSKLSDLAKKAANAIEDDQSDQRMKSLVKSIESLAEPKQVKINAPANKLGDQGKLLFVNSKIRNTLKGRLDLDAVGFFCHTASRMYNVAMYMYTNKQAKAEQAYADLDGSVRDQIPSRVQKFFDDLFDGKNL